MPRFLPKLFLSALIFIVCSLLSGQKSFASVIFQDDFNASNDTELSSYNSNWVPKANGFSNSYIYNNELVNIGNNSGYYYSGTSPLDDICVSSDFHSNWSGTSWITLVTRRMNGSSLYSGSIDNKNSYSLAKNYITVKSGQIPGGPLDSSLHNLKFCSRGDKHSLYLDNNLINTFSDSSFSSGLIAFDSANGMHIDNFTVSSTDSDVNLDVPLLKQTNPSWKNQIYDSANLWSPKSTSIGSWGCALTSAAMVFKYNGLNKLPDGSNMDPGTLNSWLKLQKDGYVGNGYVNWIALSRLSKQATAANGINNFDALEFTKTTPGTLNNVKDDLANKIPDILGEPGHFIVVKGVTGGDIKINDPYYSRGSLSDYGSSLTSLNKFTPSKTDLSYMMISYPNGINVSLKDSNDTEVGQNFQENIISNADDPSQNNGPYLNFIYLQKPPINNYHLDISSPNDTNYDIGIYLYDHDGNVLQRDEFGNLRANQVSVVPFEYDSPLNYYPSPITIKNFQNDLNKALSSKQIKVKLFVSLNLKATNALVQRKLNRKKDELGTLISMQNDLDKSKGINVFDPSYSKLLYDLNYLESHL